MVTSLQITYEIPLFIYVVLGIYTIFQLRKAREELKSGPLARAYKWFIFAAIFFTLWAVDHMFHDLMPTLTEGMKDFFHFVISHGFQLIAMVCVAIAARLTHQYTYDTKEK